MATDSLRGLHGILYRIFARKYKMGEGFRLEESADDVQRSIRKNHDLLVPGRSAIFRFNVCDTWGAKIFGPLDNSYRLGDIYYWFLEWDDKYEWSDKHRTVTITATKRLRRMDSA